MPECRARSDRRLASCLGWVVICGVCCLKLSVARAADAANEGDPKTASASDARPEVSLADLLGFAERHAPRLRQAAIRSGYAEAERAGAAALLAENPVLELAVGPRLGGNQRDIDVELGLSQAIEIGGQRGLRRQLAERSAQRLAAETRSALSELRHELSLVYRQAIVARERVAITAQLLQFADELLQVARRRLGAGDIGNIEVQLAETQAAQARQGQLRAEQESNSLALRLCELSGWPLAAPPRVNAGLGAPAPAIPSLAQTWARVKRVHPELGLSTTAIGEAAARAELARREGWPSPALGVHFAREGSVDGGPVQHVLLGTLAVPLPVWQRNQAELARARVDQELATAQQTATLQALEARVARAHLELTAASERVAIFTSSVAPPLEQGLRLLRRAFDAGEIQLLELGALRERFLAAQLEALDAYASYYAALSDMESLLGESLEPSPAAAAGQTRAGAVASVANPALGGSP
jgi:outer membrane protein, heavy metal efflux system